MKNFIKKFVILTTLLTLNVPIILAANIEYSGHTPKAVKICAKNHTQHFTKPVYVNFIMNWYGYKVYYIGTTKQNINYYETQNYILYKKTKARFPNRQESKMLRCDIVEHYNKIDYKNYKKLEKQLNRNKNRIMVIDSTQQKDITLILSKYADKYMLKGHDRRIYYVMDWKSQQVYRTYWLRYGLLPVPSSIILYDGQTIRRPTETEYIEIKRLMSDTFLKKFTG